jgi:phosphohistidine phosphatase SixA
LRPLSKAGRRQAKGLVELLRDEPIARVLSSPYVRCVQTVEPLAKSRALPVEVVTELAEGTLLSEALRLIEKVADEPTVLCTHGDVVENLLFHLDAQGVSLAGGMVFAKGSTWMFDVKDSGIVRGRYLPPAA